MQRTDQQFYILLLFNNNEYFLNIYLLLACSYHPVLLFSRPLQKPWLKSQLFHYQWSCFCRFFLLYDMPFICRKLRHFIVYLCMRIYKTSRLITHQYVFFIWFILNKVLFRRYMPCSCLLYLSVFICDFCTRCIKVLKWTVYNDLL